MGKIDGRTERRVDGETGGTTQRNDGKNERKMGTAEQKTGRRSKIGKRQNGRTEKRKVYERTQERKTGPRENGCDK